MKNIHVLPTDKPSRLYLDENKKLQYIPVVQYNYNNCVNIFITSSDEEIKEGDWCIGVIGTLIKINKKSLDLIKNLKVKPNWKKIILTTDQKLIKSGVQEIDDKFLKYFINNPSCESVKVEKYNELGYAHGIGRSCFYKRYKIIIPKEEPKQKIENHYLSTLDPLTDISRMKLDNHPDLHKQETLEEVAKSLFSNMPYQISTSTAKNKALELVKWQQERSYSEEEVLEIIDSLFHQYASSFRIDAKEYFLQFKKK